MNFAEAIEVVTSTLSRIGVTINSSNYDGFIVKKLESSNTLDDGRTTNQTHIAITGSQMDIFPYLRADGYFNEKNSDFELKKYYITQIPLALYKSNVDYLDDTQAEICFNSNKKNCYTSVVRSKRKSQADQIQVSLINFDDPNFIMFRKLLHAGSYLIILKLKEQFQYDIFGIKKQDGIDFLEKLNNKFFKLPTNTMVGVSDLIRENKENNIFDYNLYGIHIKNKNTALSEDNPHICIGWSCLGDLSEINSKDELSQLFDEKISERTKASKSQDISQIWKFKNDVKNGDYVIFAEDSVLHIGRIMSDYYFDNNENENQDKDYKNTRKVKWLKTNINRKEISETLHKSLKAARSFWTLNDYKSVVYDLLNGTYKKDDIDSTDFKEDCEEIRLTDAHNVLLYGVPGAGKSHFIDGEIDENYTERVVFHPDYTYSDFVGQILPRVEDEKLKYVFEPGPFTKILKSAYENPTEMHYLVIEEINRGNAPAIFGDIFQLLDRNDDGSGKYSISNYDIARIVYNDENHKIKMLSNLTIYATMNTSDQNIFTLDTAFQRRWEMKLVRNDVYQAKHANDPIEGTSVMWGNFASVTNTEIMRYAEETGGATDKRLGAYFTSSKELTRKLFPEKVLKYLWDDAFKMDHYTYFDNNITSLDDIIDNFNLVEDGIDPLKSILRANIYNKMISEDKNEDNNKDISSDDE